MRKTPYQINIPPPNKAVVPPRIFSKINKRTHMFILKSRVYISTAPYDGYLRRPEKGEKYKLSNCSRIFSPPDE